MSVAVINNTYYDTLSDAVAAANEMDSAVVTIVADIVLSAQLTVSGNLTITGAHTITRASTYLGALFTVSSGATLTLDGGLTIDGAHEWIFKEAEYNAALEAERAASTKDELVKYSGLAFATKVSGAPTATSRMFTVSGDLVINNVTIKNHMGNGANGVFIINKAGSLTLNDGALIAHNATNNQSTIVYISDESYFTMNEGSKITDNYFAVNGGLILNKGGLFTMNGGEISHNYGVNCNGTVIMLYQNSPIFIMNGGEICYNSSLVGSGAGWCSAIYLHQQGIMEMHGGSIHHNDGGQTGGITTFRTDTKLTITGGYVGDNTARIAVVAGDAGVIGKQDVMDYYNVSTITGGVFTQDVSEHCADGFSTQLQPDGTYGFTPYEYPIYVCVDGVIKVGGLEVCVDGVVKKIDNIYQCIDGVIKES